MGDGLLGIITCMSREVGFGTRIHLDGDGARPAISSCPVKLKEGHKLIRWGLGASAAGTIAIAIVAGAGECRRRCHGGTEVRETDLKRKKDLCCCLFLFPNPCVGHCDSIVPDLAV